MLEVLDGFGLGVRTVSIKALNCRGIGLGEEVRSEEQTAPG